MTEDFSAYGELSIEEFRGLKVVRFFPHGKTTAERDRNLFLMDRQLTKGCEERGIRRGILLQRAEGWPTPCAIFG